MLSYPQLNKWISQHHHYHHHSLCNRYFFHSMWHMGITNILRKVQNSIGLTPPSTHQKDKKSSTRPPRVVAISKRGVNAHLSNIRSGAVCQSSFKTYSSHDMETYNNLCLNVSCKDSFWHQKSIQIWFSRMCLLGTRPSLVFSKA